MTIEFSPNAEAALLNIFEWISTDSPAAALRTVLRIRQSLEILCDFPELGRAGRVEGTREFSISGLSYFASYMVDHKDGDAAILILDIVHTSRNYPLISD